MHFLLPESFALTHVMHYLLALSHCYGWVQNGSYVDILADFVGDINVTGPRKESVEGFTVFKHTDIQDMLDISANVSDTTDTTDIPSCTYTAIDSSAQVDSCAKSYHNECCLSLTSTANSVRTSQKHNISELCVAYAVTTMVSDVCCGLAWRRVRPQSPLHASL